MLPAWHSEDGAAAIDLTPIAGSDPSSTLEISTPDMDVPPDAQSLTQTRRSVTRLRRLDVDIVGTAPPLSTCARDYLACRAG